MSEVIRIPLGKRLRLSYPSLVPLCMSLAHRPSGIAGHDPGNDGAFRRQIISQLEQNFDQNKVVLVSTVSTHNVPSSLPRFLSTLAYIVKRK